MKKLLSLLVLVCLEKAVHAQYIYTIKADSVKITNSCDTAELIIENHTQNVCGFLFNRGRGRTEFRRALFKISDSIYTIGCDTLKLSNAWLQGGNRFGTTGRFGTMDNNHIDFYTNSTKMARMTNNGSFLIGTENDYGYYTFMVNGRSWFGNNLSVDKGDDFDIMLDPANVNAYHTGIGGSMITFGNTYASIGVNKQKFGNIPANSLIIGRTSPEWGTTIMDYRGNPTITVPGEGAVSIMGGYRGIDSGGAMGIMPIKWAII